MGTQPSYVQYIRACHFCGVIGIGFVSVSFIAGYPSPIEDSLLNTGMLTIRTYPLFSTAVYIGSVIGSLFAGIVNEWLGVKTTLMLFSQFGTFGGILLVLGHDGISMTIGRVLIGIYMAFCSTGLPVYSVEMVIPSLKSFVGSLVGVSLRIGTLLSYLLGVWLGYRWLAVVYILMVVFMSISLFLLPEVHKQLRNKSWVESSGNLLKETTNLIQDQYDSQVSIISNISLTQKITSYLVWPVIRPLLVCISLQIFKGMSTHEYLVAYSAHTLDNAVNIDPRLAVLFYPISLIIGGIIFLCLIHKYHWKRLLIITSCIQILANGLLGTTLYYSIKVFDCIHNREQHSICDTLLVAPIVLIAVIGVSFSMGWGSISWWSYANILHSRYIKISAGIATLIALTFISSTQLIGPVIVEYFGSHILFFLFSGICVIGSLIQLLY